MTDQTKHLGRFHQIDGSHSMTHDDGDATKRLIATFAGDHFVAEREGNELKVYAIGDSDGLPGAAVLGNTTDSGPAGLRALNRRNAARRGEGAA